MRYPSIVIPSEARNLCHSQSGTRASPHMCRAVPLFSAVFHPACALSAPSGHLPLEGKAAMRGKPASKRLSDIATICTLRRFYILMRRTAISHFSFLISHSSKAFIPSQGGSTPHRLALNLEPFPSIQNPAGVTPTGSFPIILLPFSRCGVPYTPRVWHRGSRDVRSISSSQKR